MHAQLLDFLHLALVLLDHVQSEQLKETVAVLRSKLDCELEVALCVTQVVVRVRGVVAHCYSCAFAPDFARLWDFVQCLLKSLESFCEVGFL